MPDELETILRLVAQGSLSPEEAAPIIEALTRAGRARRADDDDEEDEADDDDEGLVGLGRHADRVERRLARAHRRVDRALGHGRARIDAVQEQLGVTEGRHLRIRITERGRQVVNLRIPVAFADAALGFVPGLAGDQADRIRDAVRSGAVGPILDVEDPDAAGGVLISVE